ncbi:MAG: hypothetical protein LBJ03_03005 [Holosporales bacterium]|jgi:chromosomal replication initiation ATPase DnaA|nr:hypothetical protein [Holosporales bacterium]
MNQIILNFGDQPKLGWSDFEVGPANQAAIEWLIKWPNWPSNGLVIHGEAGCGKTHLGRLWMSMVDAELVTPNNLACTVEQCAGKHFLVDSIDILKSNEKLAFHLINIVKEKNGSLLVLDREPPFNWDIDLKDLVSRLLALSSVQIMPPDDMLLAAILATQLKSRGNVPDLRFCKYAIDRLPRTFDAVLDFVSRIDSASLQTKKPITFSLIKSILETAQHI